MLFPLYMTLTSSTLSQVFGFELSANKKYRYTGEFTEKALKAFAQSVIDETAEPDYKSAEIPAEPLDEGVTVIVGKNFESIVLDKTKDVLLEVGSSAYLIADMKPITYIGQSPRPNIRV